MELPGYRPLGRLAIALQLALVVASSSGLVVTSIQLVTGATDAEIDAYASQGTAMSTLVVLVSAFAAIVWALSFLAGIVLFPWFLHRANKNLRAFGVSDLTVSPGLAAAGWFIPLANLVYPYRAIAEIERTSAAQVSRPSAARAGTYWACYLIANALLRAGDSFAPVGILGSLVLAAAGALAILIVREVRENQESRASRVEVASVAPVFA